MYQRCVKKLLFRYTHKKLKLVKLDSIIASKKKTPRKRNRKQNYPLRSYRRSHLTARLSGNLTSKLHEGEQLIFDPHTPRPQVGMRDPWNGRGEGRAQGSSVAGGRRVEEMARASVPRVFTSLPRTQRICPFGVHVTS